MKKTLITLLVLSGVAMGETLMTDNLVGWWTFDNKSKASTSYTNTTITPTFTISDGNWKTTGGVDGMGYITSHSDDGDIVDFYAGMGVMAIPTNSFTLSFKVKNCTVDGTIFSVTAGSYGQIRILSSGAVNINGGDSVLTFDDEAVSEAIHGNDGWANVIMVGDGTNLTLNINGYTATTTYTVANDEKLSNFQLGSAYGISAARVTADFDDLAFWNRALTSSEVALLSKGATANGHLVVPEPTTAMLSLLALAGLAARRRRR